MWIIVEVKDDKPVVMVSQYFYDYIEDAKQDLQFIENMNPGYSFKLCFLQGID